jgi:hypothetical protein
VGRHGAGEAEVEWGVRDASLRLHACSHCVIGIFANIVLYNVPVSELTSIPSRRRVKVLIHILVHVDRLHVRSASCKLFYLYIPSHYNLVHCAFEL